MYAILTDTSSSPYATGIGSFGNMMHHELGGVPHLRVYRSRMDRTQHLLAEKQHVCPILVQYLNIFLYNKLSQNRTIRCYAWQRYKKFLNGVPIFRKNTQIRKKMMINAPVEGIFG